jgi:protein-S-isoprenylcysteine O-methyltransferase Ste14
VAVTVAVFALWGVFWLYWLAAAAGAKGVVGSYFIHSARVEEQLLRASFPTAYPSYRARTKMLIPFLL